MREDADGAGPESDEDLRAIVGEALEVAPQPAGAGRAGERIGGGGEVVEPDRLVAPPGQPFMTELGLPEARFGRGQQARIDPPLPRNEMRHMRIAEQCDPVGAERGGPTQGVFQHRDILPRQAVHQVEVQRLDSGGAKQVHGDGDQPFILHTADPLLDGRVEGLHPKARLLDAGAGKGARPLMIETARIDFDRNQRILHVEGAAQMPSERNERLGWHGIRTATAEGDAAHVRPAAQAGRHDVDLPPQRLQIGVEPSRPVGRAGVAAAIPAYLPAKGEMDVERNLRTHGHAGERDRHFVLTDALMELRGGGIGSVARHGCREQLGKELPAHAGRSSSSIRIRSAAPSMSSNCPLRIAQKKAPSAQRPRPSAIGIR